MDRFFALANFREYLFIRSSFVLLLEPAVIEERGRDVGRVEQAEQLSQSEC
jgi:hypothetical protein